MAPLGETSLAIDWAWDITADLGLFVAILPRTLVTTIQGWLRDVVNLGAGASAAEVASSTLVGNLCIALVVRAPLSDARDWAVWLRADCCWRFVCGRVVNAFLTTMLCRRQLDPLAGLGDDNLRHRVKAISGAFAVLGPCADCRNRARNWLWITRASLHLVNVTALLATELGFHRDDPMTTLCAVRTAPVRASIPLRPIALAIDWAGDIFVAACVLDVACFVWALLSTMECFLRNDVDGLCLTTST